MNYLYIFVFLFLGTFSRYYLFAVIAERYFYQRGGSKIKKSPIIRHPYKSEQKKTEIYYSMLSSVMFGAAFTGLYILWERGMLHIYFDLNDYGILYTFISFFLVLFIHDTYYYWLHRWMHTPKIYRIVHRVHHDSRTPSPWTSFSFHPYETIFQILIFYFVLFLIPLHPVVCGFYVVVMSVSSLINHLNVEFYSEGFCHNKITKNLIGATHHALHHKYHQSNLGLYFTFWDKWCKTENEKFETYFKRSHE